jgi:glycosyltransferase involved in cell wall biosynthesis
MLLKTLPFLKSAEHFVCALKGRGKIGARLEEAGVKVFYLEMKNVLDFGAIKRYKKIIKECAPDIQVNYLIHADIFGRLFAKKAGVPKLISYIRNRHTKLIFQLADFFTLSAVDYLLANSQAVFDYYRRRYRFPAERSAAIPNGIDLEKIDSAAAAESLRADLGIKDDELVLVSVARLHRQKDLPTLLRALALVREKGFSRPRLLVCGAGRESGNLARLAEVLGVLANVNFLGVRPDIPEILKIADVFILPSLHEGMSNALLEAMAAGSACIVSAIPENKELIKDKDNGLIFQPGNEIDLAEKIMALAASPSSAAAFGAKAREAAAAYDIKKIIARLDDFFSERAEEKKKIIWVANDRNQVSVNFFNSLGEVRPDLDLFLLAGDKEASEGRDKFFRWKVFPFSGRRLFAFLSSPLLIAAKLKKKSIDIIKLDFYRGLYSLLRKENPDLVMANLYLQPTSWQALVYCFIHRKPLVLLEEKKHLGRTRPRRALSLAMLFFSAPLFFFVKKIYCHTSDGLNFGRRYFPILDKSKIDLLPAVVDTRDFYSEHLPKDESRLNILIIARMVPFKRYGDLLRAIKAIKDRKLFKFILNIRGEGPEEKIINSLIDELGIRAEVNFLPFSPHEKLRDFYNQNDILVLPSFNEPIGVVAPEAMACGLPVIVSDTCGAKTYVKDGVNGYIFKTFDYFDLAEKIILLADPDRRKSMGEAAGKAIREEFDSRLAVKAYFEKIKNLL